MELKKSKKADLERMKGLFFQIGLIVSMGLVLTAFEWGRSNNSDIAEVFKGTNDTFEEEIETIRQTTIQQAPPPVQPEVFVLTDIDPADELEFQLDPTDFTPNLPPVITINVSGGTPPEDDIYEPFEIDMQAEFMGGGTDRFQKWVMEHLKYPQIAIDNQIEGTVHIRFVINKKGQLAEVQLVRGVDESVDNETFRVINKSPTWKPALRKGVPVSVAYQMPVKFKLN